MTWQPIETAPRDGTEVVLLMPARPPYVPERFCVVGAWGRYGWEGSDGVHSLNDATHWAALPPLPPPPERGGKSG